MKVELLNKNKKDLLELTENIGLKLIGEKQILARDSLTVTDRFECFIEDDTKNILYKDFKGAIVTVRITDLKASMYPLPIKTSNKYSINNIKVYIKNKKYECRLISEEYINKKSLLNFQCGCGNVFATRWNTFRNSDKTMCDACGRRKGAKSKIATGVKKQGSFKELLIDIYGDKWIDIWNFEKNDVDPDMLSRQSTTKVWLNCDRVNYHTYEIQCGRFSSGVRCGYCSGTKTHINDSLGVMRPKISQYWSEKNKVKPEDVYYNTSKKYWFKCPNNKHDDSLKEVRELVRGKCICRECSYESRSGENHSSWKGGITHLNAYLRNSIDDWKIETMKKYNYRCDISNEKNNFEIHHLTGFATIVSGFVCEYNIDVKSNIGDYTQEELDYIRDEFSLFHMKYGLGVLLSEDIHKLFHKIYGKDDGNNSKEQYYEFKEKYLKNEITDCF